MTDTIKLYEVTSLPKVFSHKGANYFGARIAWFHWDAREREAVPYEQVIGDYATADKDTRWAAERIIDEMFTETEMVLLRDYLGDDEELEVVCQKLPFPVRPSGGGSWMPTGQIPVGGPQDFLLIYERPAYLLPFRVAGYFDVRGLSHARTPDSTAPFGEVPWAQQHEQVTFV